MANALDLVIIASVNVNRAHLLERSLRTWDYDIANTNLRVGIRLFSEGWDATHIAAETLKNCKDWHVYSGEQSGSHIRGYNHILNHVVADKYLFTHGEIMFSTNTLQSAYDASIVPDTFVSFKIAFLGAVETINLENYDWFPAEKIEHLGILNANEPAEKMPFYYNGGVREDKVWETTATWCMGHDTLQKLRPFPDFKSWGADDLYFATARKWLGIETHTLADPILFHQWHEREKGPDAWTDITAMAVKALNERFGNYIK